MIRLSMFSIALIACNPLVPKSDLSQPKLEGWGPFAPYQGSSVVHIYRGNTDLNEGGLSALTSDCLGYFIKDAALEESLKKSSAEYFTLVTAAHCLAEKNPDGSPKTIDGLVQFVDTFTLALRSAENETIRFVIGKDALTPSMRIQSKPLICANANYAISKGKLSSLDLAFVRIDQAWLSPLTTKEPLFVPEFSLGPYTEESFGYKGIGQLPKMTPSSHAPYLGIETLQPDQGNLVIYHDIIRDFVSGTDVHYTPGDSGGPLLFQDTADQALSAVGVAIGRESQSDEVCKHPANYIIPLSSSSSRSLYEVFKETPEGDESCAQEKLAAFQPEVVFCKSYEEISGNVGPGSYGAPRPGLNLLYHDLDHGCNILHLRHQDKSYLVTPEHCQGGDIPVGRTLLTSFCEAKPDYSCKGAAQLMQQGRENPHNAVAFVEVGLGSSNLTVPIGEETDGVHMYACKDSASNCRQWEARSARRIFVNNNAQDQGLVHHSFITDPADSGGVMHGSDNNVSCLHLSSSSEFGTCFNLYQGFENEGQ